MKLFSLLISAALGTNVAAAPGDIQDGLSSSNILEMDNSKNLRSPAAARAKGVMPGKPFATWITTATAGDDGVGVTNGSLSEQAVTNGIIEDREEPLARKDEPEVENADGASWGGLPSGCRDSYNGFPYETSNMCRRDYIRVGLNFRNDLYKGKGVLTPLITPNNTQYLP